MLVGVAAVLAVAACAPALAGVDEGLNALAVKDFARARAEFEALPNDAQAIYHLSRMAWHGYGEPANPVRRFGLLQRAAAMGHARAKFEVAWLTALGAGTTADPEAAVGMLEQADAEGNIDATVLLGRVYRFAWWKVPQDWPRSAVLLKKASDEGSDLGSTLYATSLIQGVGVPADPPAGYQLLQKMADKGFVEAQLELARVLSEGTGGLAKDLAAAYALYLGVARQGDPFAQYMTCMALLDGRGVARDVRAASRWCDGAARQGDAWAQLRLAEMFRSGTGMPRLPGQAYSWLTVAASGKESASGIARERRARLAQEISQPEIERQTKRAAGFRAEAGLRVREAPLPDLARGDRITLDNVAISIPAPQGYFNNWEFVENFQRAGPNNPELRPNLLVLTNREDMDRFKLGLNGSLRSVEVGRHIEEDINVTPGIFADMRKSLVEAVEKTRATGRMKVDVVRNDEAALLLFREALNGGDGVDARAWVRVNGRVVLVWFTGFTYEQLQDLRQLAPATVKSILAQNGPGLFNLFGSTGN
ncbi:tetratricopeptide repeat protein [Ramlibacter sp. AN1133]|uniref:tetratricopeptide repeat protein n=1 Tax=Ramlibacter sp. AN1133 TaxID=3133429 RepID=UPI0030C35575